MAGHECMVKDVNTAGKAGYLGAEGTEGEDSWVPHLAPSWQLMAGTTSHLSPAVLGGCGRLIAWSCGTQSYSTRGQFATHPEPIASFPGDPELR